MERAPSNACKGFIGNRAIARAPKRLAGVAQRELHFPVSLCS
jgi:hypothetical protein